MSAPPLLPALAVALGLPLCRDGRCSPAINIDGAVRGGGDGGDVGVGDDRLSSERDDDTSSTARSIVGTSRRRREDDRRDLALARRAGDNASRIYARRVIDRARLDREHPWASAAASSVDGGGRGNASHGRNSAESLPNRDDLGVDDGKLRKLRDQLLSETLISLIELKERASKVKSFTSSNLEGVNNVGALFRGNNNNNNNNNCNNLLSVLGILPTNGNNIACCESISSKQRTLNEYNALSVPTSTKGADGRPKPAEWSDDIDLVKKRLEFGKEISPLSNTTRLQRWGMALKRIITLGMLAAPLGVMVPANALLGNLAGDGKRPGKDDDGDNDAAAGRKETTLLRRCHRDLTRRTWDYALWAVESAGPTYVKLVQWASTRNDLFSPEFVGHFSKLQDETRGHSWHDTEKALAKAFGEDWRSVLSFDRVIEDEDDESDGKEGGRLKRTGGMANRARQKRLERNESQSSSEASSAPTIPIGSGCVAQVYKARLNSSHGLHPAGTSVAVKVQHPRILEKVCLDFYIMNKLASALERIPYFNLDYLSVKDSVDQFRDIMLPQLDLRVEAHNLRRFRRDFEGEARIAFPEPLGGLTSREVLVERFVEGEPMLNFVTREDERHSKKDREELATIGLKTVMEMIFLHDFVHADLHPGNMIVDRNKSVRGQPLRVHMIDCGLIVELGERDHMNLVKILGSLVKRDGYAAGKLMVDTAKKCQATELDVEMFCRGIEKICADDVENNFLESVGDYITDICYLACRHKVKLEAAFINAALACEIMEGLASSLYPDMKVQSVALPMVLKAEMMHGLKGKFGYF